MKKCRKLLSLAMAVCIVASMFATPVYATGPNSMLMQAPVSYNPENNDFYIFGTLIPLPADQHVVFDEDSGEFGELFIPLRALMEVIGGEVAWDAATATVTILLMGVEFKFAVTDSLNGIKPMIIRNRVYIPSEYLIETLMVETLQE